MAAPPTPNRPRVLIIEDNRDSRESLCWLLELAGFEVRVAADGLEGLQAALRWLPEAAVVDIGLPLLDGYEVARRVRATVGDAVRLVALTGYGQPSDRQQALEAGFDLHLVKPAEAEVLLGWLRRQA
jgi:CheY-like chemotaxis protein